MALFGSDCMHLLGIMDTVESLRDLLHQEKSANSKMAGQMGAIAKYMDIAGIPKQAKIQRRVKLLAVLYQQALLENKRLTVLLEDFSNYDA